MLFRNSTIILVVCFCMLTSKEADSKILWNKDLIFDINTNSFPLASCVNKDTNSIFVITKVGPRGSFLLKESGNGILWEIAANGSILYRALLKDAGGNTLRTNATASGPSCAMAIDNSGKLLTIGVLGEQKKERSLSIISTKNEIEPNLLTSNRIDYSTIKKLLPFQSNSFIMIGNKGDNGLCMQIDDKGKMIHEELFDLGQTEIFSGADWVKPHNLNLVVVGISTKINIKEPTKNYAENFILIYDPNLNLVHKDYFTEGLPGLLFPKVCCLDDGKIVVLHRKKGEDPNKTLLWVRCYTQELKSLWEKEIFTTNKTLFACDIISQKSANFLIGMIREDGLEFYSFNNEGIKASHTIFKGMVGIAGFNLMRINNETVVLFEEGTEGNIKECSVKAKIIALD